MPTVFITGARAGLGLEFAHQYAEAGWRVIAPGRQECDVIDMASIGTFISTLGEAPIDLLINNAGVRNAHPSGSKLGEFTLEGWLPSLTVNVVGPALVTQALLPNLMRGDMKRVVTLSSRLGSIAGGGGSNSGGGGSSYYAYRASKAALNQVNNCLSIDLGPRGFTCVVVNPGWVQTRMGGANATMSPADSIAQMRRLIDGLKPDDNGKFIDANGAIIPW